MGRRGRNAPGDAGSLTAIGYAGRSRPWRGALAACAAFVLLAAGERPAHAGYAAIVVDAATGATLHRENADTLNYPASLAKMMTLYLVFESLDHGVVSLDTRLPVSAYAAARPPSKLGLPAGGRIALRDAIRTLATKSANDVATVIAEYFSGSEAAFARLMTSRARALGMSRTTFRNASGLPDRRMKTTARDIATLGMALYRRFDHYTHFFAERSVRWGGRSLRNTNRLLGAYPGMNGIKTGYIRASGFNLAASVERDGVHIIAVVMGGKSSKARNARMRTLLDRALADARASRNFLATVRRPRAKPAPGGGARPAVAAAAVAIPRGAWSIQVGAYSRRDAAARALELARFAAPGLLAGQDEIEEIRGGEGILYRARQTGLTEEDARRACGEIALHRLPCAVVEAPASS